MENGTTPQNHSNIWFTYGANNGSVNGVSVGVENADGQIGSSYFFQGAGIAPAVGTDLRVVALFNGVAEVPVAPPAALLGLGLLALGVSRRRAGILRQL